MYLCVLCGPAVGLSCEFGGIIPSFLELGIDGKRKF
jgi:hypothetical protein